MKAVDVQTDLALPEFALSKQIAERDARREVVQLDILAAFLQDSQTCAPTRQVQREEIHVLQTHSALPTCALIGLEPATDVSALPMPASLVIMTFLLELGVTLTALEYKLRVRL